MTYRRALLTAEPFFHCSVWAGSGDIFEMSSSKYWIFPRTSSFCSSLSSRCNCSVNSTKYEERYFCTRMLG